MMRLKRRNTAWLAMIGSMVALAFISGAVPAQAMLLLVGLLAVAVAASVIEVRPEQLREGLPPSPLTRMRMSTEAREAVDRARRRGGYTNSDLTLIDIGLISSHASPEGVVMRKSRSISGDDDGVRPFISLQVPPADADRTALVRFEIVDSNGERQYIHEMRTYLRDGEMNILADHHLPLFSNEKIAAASGDWDLRVMVDGALAGVLSFTVTPAIDQRFPARRDRLADAAEEQPMSLEDLMRQSRDSRARK